MTTQPKTSTAIQIIREFMYWIVSLYGFGSWLCLEAQIATPIVTDTTHWHWAWLIDTNIPILSKCLLPILVGLALITTFFLIIAIPRILLRRHAKNRESGIVARISKLRFYGIAFAVAWVMCWLAQYITTSWQWAPALRAALFAAGRIMILAMCWDALMIRKLLEYTSPFIAKYATAVFILIAASIAITLSFNNIKLTGDEPSYVFMAGSIRNDQNLIVDAGELLILNQMAQMPPTHRVHQVAIKDSNGIEQQAPWHFAGPAIAILPAWFAAEWFSLPLYPAMRFYMLALFLLWMTASYHLARRLTGWPTAALAATVAVAISCPMLALSKSVFPDNMTGYLLMAALCLAADVFGGKTKQLPIAKAAGIIAIACLIPWMHYKYGLLSIVLGAFVLRYRPTLNRKNAMILFSILIAGVAAFVAYYYKTYGTNLIGEPSEQSTGSGFFGIFLDNDSGLITYAPYLILIPAGVIALARFNKTYTFGITWTLLFLAIYLPTANTPFWGSPGSPVLRYFCPIMACTAPLIAGAFASLRYRSFIIFIMLLIPALAFYAFYQSNWQVYGAPLQTGRTLLDHSIDAFSWNEFFPYYVFSFRTLNNTGSTLQTILILLIIIALYRGLEQHRRNRKICVAMLMATPILLASAARISEAPNFAMNALRMFTTQTHRIAKLGNIKTSTIQETPTIYLPLTVKPFNTEGFRTITKSDALDLDFRRPAGNFATLVTHYELHAGKYRFALLGIPNADTQTTSRLTMKVQERPSAKVLGIMQSEPMPIRNAQMMETQTDTELLTGTVTLEENRTIRIVLQADEGPAIHATKFKMEYLGKN